MFESITDLAGKLAATGYFIDPVMTQVVFLAAKLQKPLLLEGPAGSGKTQLAAFTVAWEHPDAFRRVFTAIGTFVGMRGGEQYYVLVRKTEPKPLRIFMQDGVHDEWPGGPEMGDWWMSNQTMSRALEFAGYDVRHVWGAGTHNGSQAASIFPEAMRWLWRDWPAAISVQTPGNPVLKQILKPTEDWTVAADGCSVSTLESDPTGKIFYRNEVDAQVSELPVDETSVHCRGSETGGAFAFGPDGKVYIALAQGGIEVREKAGSPGSLGYHLKTGHTLSVQNRPTGLA